MGVEIERKFLVNEAEWQDVKPVKGTHILQGYLSKEIERTVRVRVKGEKGFLTVKGKNTGAKRAEFEYEIPIQEAKEMLETMCDAYIDKIRYEVHFGGKIWEVDEFSSPKRGLILAEVELNDENEAIDFPSWITDEVTNDKNYYNSNMI
jgi:CYTH domain-containing protein